MSRSIVARLSAAHSRTAGSRSYSQVPLGADSLVTFFERRSHMIIRENTFEDGGPCQIFGGLYHAVIAENTLTRSDGIIVEGLENTQGPMMAAAVRAAALAAQPGGSGDIRRGTHAGVPTERNASANPPLPDIQYPTYIPTYFIEVLDNIISEMCTVVGPAVSSSAGRSTAARRTPARWRRRWYCATTLGTTPTFKSMMQSPMSSWRGTR